MEVLEGRYRLRLLLGRGGAADVYVADDLRLARQVAVKRYRVGRRCRAEAELLARLSHPRLLTVFDVDFDGDQPFVVLEYAAAGTLRDRLDTGGPLWPDRVAALGAELADVLAYVHDHGIVHRDVKPSNVLFNTDGECYLADFGIARALDAQAANTDEFVGTASYLAPEQVLGHDPGAGVDVYALGLVLLECLTGTPAYPGAGAATAAARLTRPPKIPGAWGPEWRAVLTAMTAADPAQRPDAHACAAMLRAVAAGKTAIVPRRRTHRVAAAVAALAVLTATAFTVKSEPTGTPMSDPAQPASAVGTAVVP